MPLNIKLDRPLILIGLMGAGKSTVGRALADHFGLPFVDSDEEIEAAADCSISDIFEIYGEVEFRALEKRVMDRLINHGPMILATGGGAFINEQIRHNALDRGIVIWLSAGLDSLVNRTSRRGGRPLLKVNDPRETLKKLMDERYPIYGKAHIIIDTDDETLDSTLDKIIFALKKHAEPTK